MKTVLFLNLIFLWAQNVCAAASPTISPSSPLYIQDGGSFALTCEIDQDVTSVTWKRNGYSAIQITNTTVCTSRPLATNNYSVTCYQQRRFIMVILGVNNSEHNTNWTCLMYALDYSVLGPSSAVRLLMRDPVDSVHLLNGTNLTLNENQSAVLVCQTDACRPSAAIYWMKDGNNITDSNTSVTTVNLDNDLFISSGTLSYTGQRGDNRKILTCGAYNDLESVQTSGKLTVTIYYPPDGPPVIEGQTNGSDFIVIENTSQKMTCQIIGGNPLANLTWDCMGHQGLFNTSGQTVESNIVLVVDRGAQGKRCSCQTSHPVNGNKDVFVSLQVLYPPSIHGLTSPYKVIEFQPLSVTCQVSSNPPPDSISWSPNGEGSVPSRLYFSSVSRNNSGFYNCTAQNTMKRTNVTQQTGTNTSQIQVDVLYPPAIQGLTSPYRVIEFQPLNVTCQVSSNPPPDNISWSPSGEGSVPSRLYFSSVSRNNSGFYNCTAQNTMKPANGTQQTGTNMSQIQVDVLYAAKITEFVAKDKIYEIMEKSTLELYCHVDSNPYSVISLSFGDVLKSKTEDTNKLIYSATAGCLDAGKYICNATNSVINGLTASAEVNLKVQCGPRLDYRKNISTEYYRALNDNVTMKVYIIAYPEPTDIMWYHRGDKTDKWQHIPNQPLSSSGLYSSITIHLISQGEFGVYLVNMTNNFGIYNLTFHVIPESLPGIPTEFSVSEERQDSVKLEWLPGFWGGHTQYFVIQFRIYAGGTWIDTYPIQENTNEPKQYFTLKGLQPKTTYEFQMYARNEMGTSNTTQVINTTTSEVVQTTQGFQVGAIAGGLGAGAIVAAICIILVILYVRRKKQRNNEEGTPLELRERNEVKSNRESGLLDNPLYVTSGSEYAAVVKPKKKAALVEDHSNLYAQVDKPNKNGKKGAARKDGKTSRGDIYENIGLGEKRTISDREYENSRQKTETSDGNVYENPGAVAHNSQQVNKDGLLYADLMLDQPTTKNGKVVIHGIENQTEYAEIAYGKKGEPLPDDEEEKH